MVAGLVCTTTISNMQSENSKLVIAVGKSVMLPCTPRMLCIILPLVFARLVPCFTQGAPCATTVLPTIEVHLATVPVAGSLR
jgi:hypothetical protein